MNRKVQNILTGGDKPGRVLTLGIQHVFAMFGSTVLVPALTGLDPAVTLFCMGIGTLIFHLITSGKVPAFMGSSFSFIASITAVAAYYGYDASSGAGMGELAAYVGGGIIASGLMYVILALIVKLIGAKRVTGFFPPVVTGCMIIIIGMMLAPTAMGNITNVPGTMADNTKVAIVNTIERQETDEHGNAKTVTYGAYEDNGATYYVNMADMSATEEAGYTHFSLRNTKQYTMDGDDLTAVSSGYTWKYWLVAVFTVLVVVLVMFFAKGFLSLIPILIGIIAGYLLSLALGLVDFAPVASKSLFDVPHLVLPKFSWYAISMIAPISIVTFVEHVGDITANGAVTGCDYIEDPGLHRTLLGCGLASIFSGAMGGPAATTYSENTGVLAATRNYNPATLRVAAVFALLLSFFGKVCGVLQTIPAPVMGGVSIVLFGMIASVGLRMLVENGVDFTKNRNLIIAAMMMVIGLGLTNGITIGSVTVSGVAIAALLGIILNKVLPSEAKEAAREEKARKEKAQAKK